jgi:hypothetical protein
MVPRVLTILIETAQGHYVDRVCHAVNVLAADRGGNLKRVWGERLYAGGAHRPGILDYCPETFPRHPLKVIKSDSVHVQPAHVRPAVRDVAREFPTCAGS